ncbi:MAG: hypothetical protein LBB85_07570 [Dysgonamonadaceae bacterium]|jgi:hypothetical protein|nr:hypothetical protein [Dysgonamonadaceae bacterium]
MRYKIFFLAVIVLFASEVKAQDVESVIQSPLLSTNGGVSMSHLFTLFPGDTTAVQHPYAFYLSGNLNLNFLGVVAIPLSFAYTNQQLSKNISLPFNRFSLAPSYKWMKAYAGYTSLHFSPYTLAGHELFGGGIELTPDNGLKVSAVYGRLKQQSFGEDNTDPSFKRMGGGFNVEYKKEQFEVGVNFFKAQDMLSSEYLAHPDSMDLLPQDNLSGSIKAGINFIKNLRLTTEYGISALNRNIYPTGNSRENRFRMLATEGDLAIFHAMKTQLTYTQPIGSIGATYEKVDPNYTTLGAYYMTNDFENITANFSTAIKKVNIAVSGGYQRDNLHKQKNNTSSRIIYSANLSSNMTEKLSVAFNLSNLQSYVYINDIYDRVTQTNEFQNLDTLNVTQLNYTTSLNSSYILQSAKEKRQSVNLNFMYQKSAEAQQYSRFSGNDIYNTGVAYQLSILPIKLNASASVSYNYNRMPEDVYTQALSYNVSLQKTFFSNLRSALTATYSRMSHSSGQLANVMNIRISEGYVFAQKHNFNLSLTLLNNKNLNQNRLQYAANLSYAYNFNITVSRKERKIKLDYDF